MTKSGKIALGIGAVIVTATAGVLIWNYYRNKQAQSTPEPKTKDGQTRTDWCGTDSRTLKGQKCLATQ